MRLKRKDFPLPIIQPIREMDNRIDDVLKKLSTLERPSKTDNSAIGELAQEVAALRASREKPWEFDIVRNADGRITRVKAQQVRPRLI